MPITFPDILYAFGFSYWKRPILKSLLPESTIRFVHSTHNLPTDSYLLLWGQQQIPDAVKLNIIRVEDGFLRSVGLGADLVRPLSWVFDHSGLYYDATQTSDLEYLLQNTVFPAETIERATKLRQLITHNGLSKYNVGSGKLPDFPSDRKKILVIGQVESDASIRKGGCGISSNLDLIKQVKSSNPDAYIIYKPHPDVEAGLRAKGANEDLTSSYCNTVIRHTSITDLFRHVDEVHVMTSLTGFEALLRNKTVFCYGHPFYAGWGLTHDWKSIPRRTRNLSLDELVAASLIFYPRYISPHSRKLVSAEEAIHSLIRQTRKDNKTPVWRHLLRPLLRLWLEVRGKA